MYLVRRSLWTVPLLGLVFAAAGAADEFHVPQVRLPLMKVPPTIDGTVGDGQWAGAARMERFGKKESLVPLEASFWVGSDGKELFLAVVSETPPGGKLLSRIVPLPDGRNARTWLDDSVELVLDPNPAAPAGQRRLFHANINARGAIHQTAYLVGGNAMVWQGNWRIASKIIGDRWHLELALPLKDLGLDRIALGQPMGVRVCRNWHQTPLAAGTEWSPLGGAYLKPETIPTVTWDAAAPVVQVRQLTAPGRPGAYIKLTVFNPGTAPLDAKVALECKPKNSAPARILRTLTVRPGESAPVELTGSAMNEDVYTLIRVTSPDEKTIYYLRDFLWRCERPQVAWTPDQAAARKIQTLFAYYPSFDKIHFRADISDLEERGKVRQAKLALRRKGNGQALDEAAMPPFVNNQSRILWDIPPLGEGQYELCMTLDGISVAPIVHPFVRHVFPWEHNRLGKSDVVVEPFTPIEVKGRTVSTILRKHTLDELGLWEQVESLDKPLLYGPMRLELTAAGRTAAVAGRGLTVVKRTGTQVVTKSAWKAGSFQGQAQAEWDYDGMMKWTLEIAPSSQGIEKLVLVIPLREKLMPLFHACTDGLRFNYAGATPAGQGRVWDGSKAPRNSIVGSYVPYIWLGAEERGFSVFGENDRGWITAAGVPCQELVRQGDVLELRLNLIAKPVVLDAPRRILIGLLSTPSKPMPKGWRMWSESYGLKPPPGGKFIQFSGSCWTWGALTPCLDVYPRDEDFSIWEQFAHTKRTGMVDADFIAKWAAGFPNRTPEERKRNLSNTRAGFHILVHKPQDVLVYTNGRGVRFDTREGQTFLDEWHCDAFTTRTWEAGGGVAYGLNPVESYRDYAMWNYKKMFETFVEHIYWDDIFMQSCFNIVGTEACELSADTIQPASGLFEMRELIRRTAVLQHELGFTGRCNQVHITNTAIAPILSFAGTHLTWEDRAGETDFQDRFSRDYIRAESIGRQHGNVPFALHLVGVLSAPKGDEAKAKLKWVDRTYAGVLLVHEMRSINRIEVADAALAALYDYGYGTDSVHVANYWDEDLPITLSRADASHLVVARPGSAMVVVCDFGNGGDVLLTLDRKQLGISGKLTAADVETGRALEVTGDRAVRVPLKKHDFMLVRIAGRVEESSRP
jgi:hypothetical protein